MILSIFILDDLSFRFLFLSFDVMDGGLFTRCRFNHHSHSKYIMFISGCFGKDRVVRLIG